VPPKNAWRKVAAFRRVDTPYVAAAVP